MFKIYRGFVLFLCFAFFLPAQAGVDPLLNLHLQNAEKLHSPNSRTHYRAYQKQLKKGLETFKALFNEDPQITPVFYEDVVGAFREVTVPMYEIIKVFKSDSGTNEKSGNLETLTQNLMKSVALEIQIEGTEVDDEIIANHMEEIRENLKDHLAQKFYFLRNLTSPTQGINEKSRGANAEIYANDNLFLFAFGLFAVSTVNMLAGGPVSLLTSDVAAVGAIMSISFKLEKYVNGAQADGQVADIKKLSQFQKEMLDVILTLDYYNDSDCNQKLQKGNS